MNEIRPSDVYQIVTEMNAQIQVMRTELWYTKAALYALCILVGLQIIAKVVIFTRIGMVLASVSELLVRCGRSLGIVEQHVELTDRKAERVEHAAHGTAARIEQTAQKVEEVKQAVEAVPDKVKDKLEGTSQSGFNLRPPPGV